MATRIDNLNSLLRNLVQGTPDVEACALLSDDGLMIASYLPQNADETRVAGMTATLASLGTRAAKELDRGAVEQVMIRGSQGYAVMQQAPADTLLLVLATRTAKLGLIFLDMRNAVDDIKKYL